MFDPNLLKPLDLVVFVNDSRGIKKGTKAVFIQPTNDCGYNVAHVALLDEDAESFLIKHSFNSVYEHIENKRKNCIFGESQWYNPFNISKPYFNDIVSLSQLKQAEAKLLEQANEINKSLSSIQSIKRFF